MSIAKKLMAAKSKKRHVVFGLIRDIDRLVSFDVTDGSLDTIQTFASSTLLDSATHISIDPVGRVLYVANRIDGILVAYSINADNSVTYRNQESITSLVGVDFSEALNVVITYVRDSASVIVQVRNSTTLELISSSTISGGTNQYDSYTNLDDDSGILHVAFYKGASLYDHFVASFKLTSSTVTNTGVTVVGTDVGNPPYVGFNTTKKHIYTARSGSQGIQIRSYDATTGVVGAVFDTIPSPASSFSIPMGNVDPQGRYVLADDSTAVSFFDSDNSYNFVSTLYSSTYSDFGEMRNQALAVGDTGMLITGGDEGVIRLWDISNITSPILLDTDATYSQEVTWAYLPPQ